MDNSRKTKSLSVIIPAFNEEKIIKQSISLLNDELKRVAEDYEIIVIDDDSSDQTPPILEKLSAKISELKIVRNNTNQGLGNSLRKGFSLASKDLVFYTDADLPIDYGQIIKAVNVLEGSRAEILTAFRRNKTSEPLYRIIYSFVYNWLIRLLFRIRIKDINFSFRLMQRDILNKLNLKSNGSFIDAEMMIKAVYTGYRIKQIGTTYFRQKGRSTLAEPRVILKILGKLIKYYPEIMKIKKEHEKISHR